MTLSTGILIFCVVIIAIITLWLIGYCSMLTEMLIASVAETARLRELFIMYAVAKAKTDEAQTNAIIQLEYRNACVDKAAADHLAKTNPPIAPSPKDKSD